MTGTERLDQVIFFDIDNCLYPLDLGLVALTTARIHALALTAGLSTETVTETCETYYRDYGLTVRGLMKHHGVKPSDFNEKVDGSLPLETLIKPDPELRRILKAVKIRRWAFTNAGIDHARRVLRCLGIEDLFEGITFCDYAEIDFPCKPERAAYERAMLEAGVTDPRMCYFVDDSAKNVEVAIELGWTAVEVSQKASTMLNISRIHELPQVLPQLFDQTLFST
ncbi:suppressor of deletion of TFIIS [Coemansia erecta]|uniref:Suppressor of deletion of TFIIS n=1 Tax=Coemansia asiatica TaxID=1052880 RepID=A0A9W7XIL5_9FUNG|nr:suppressor of deletion of TFIIS [Coemansia asiatica]KAJ2842756.1 suppressor of deletion of TFIIS [Coemansia erecta]KAJ2873123.1 suppressor of deletion of TFIIS [Coemansia asiatica]